MPRCFKFAVLHQPEDYCNGMITPNLTHCDIVNRPLSAIAMHAHAKEDRALVPYLEPLIAVKPPLDLVGRCIGAGAGAGAGAAGLSTGT